MALNGVNSILEYDGSLVSALDNVAESAEHIGRINKWFESSKKARESKSDRWRKNENLYYGNHWGNINDSDKWKTRMVYNFPFSAVETILPIIGDFMPVVDILPKESNDVYFADMLHKRFKQIANQSNLYQKLIHAIKDSLIYSNGMVEILPSFQGERFVGFDVEVVDPFTVFPESYATDIGFDNGHYFIFAVPMHLDKIEHDFGVRPPSEGNLDEYMAFQIEDGEDNANAKKDTPMALVKECYYDDPDKENYPFGRHTVVAGETLLVDEPLELSRIPVFMVGNYKSPHNFWGVGEPELARTIVKTVNETMSSIADSIKKTAFPSRLVTPRAKSKQKRPFTGKPAEEIVVDDVHNDIGWQNPSPIPGYVQNYIQQNSFFMDAITGVQDVTQGRTPTGVKSGRAIMALQEASQTRIRFKINHEIKRFVREIGEYMVELIQIYDTEIQSIREKNPTGAYEFTQYDPNGMYDANGIQEGQEGFEPSSAKTLRDSNFEIEVASGSRYPGGRMAKEERAIELYQQGIYGIEDVAKALDEPDKQDLIERWYQRQGAPAPGEGEQEQASMDEQLLELVAMANEGGPGSPEEEQLLQVILQQPEIIQSPAIEELNPEIMERIVQVMQAEAENA